MRRSIELALLSVGLVWPGRAFAAPEVVQLWLVDAERNERIELLEGSPYLDLPMLPPQLTIEAEASPDTQSVEMFLDGASSSVENLAPYSLDGDDAGDFIAVPRLREPGYVQVTAYPYGADNLGGEAGARAELVLVMLQPDFVVDDPRDARDVAPGDGRCATAASRCTLRAAIEEANALPGEQRVVVDGRAGVYRLELGQIAITDHIAVKGYHATQVDAQGDSRIFAIDGTEGTKQIHLVGLELANGFAGWNDRGGALEIRGSRTTLSNCVVRASRANIGGGLYIQNQGQLTLFETVVTRNIAGEPERFGGGGITQRGGGIAIVNASVRLFRSVVSNNLAVRGGGITNMGGALDIENSSVIDNDALTIGGGIENFRGVDGSGGSVRLSFATIAGNEAGSSSLDGPERRRGGGLYNEGSVRLSSTILAANRDPWDADDANESPDCWSPFGAAIIISNGRNLIGVASGNCRMATITTATPPRDLRGNPRAPLDVGLRGPFGWNWLAYYGLASTSPAIDRGKPPSDPDAPCPSTDSRGVARPRGAGCDSGAVESY
jgi:hypothetical protein